MTTDHPPDAGYADALAELERIIAQLDDDHIDIDVLAARVERASELIKFCRTRIASARTQVDRIVADLELLAESDPANGS